MFPSSFRNLFYDARILLKVTLLEKLKYSDLARKGSRLKFKFKCKNAIMNHDVPEWGTL